MSKANITLDEDLLRWARNKAADENISLSKLISQLMEGEKQAQYLRAYEQWKALGRDLRVQLDASQRLSREEIYKR